MFAFLTRPEVFSPVLLTLRTILYRALELCVHLIKLKFYSLWDSLFPFTPSPRPMILPEPHNLQPTITLLSVPWSWTPLNTAWKWDRGVFVFLWVVYFTSVFIHVVAWVSVSFFMVKSCSSACIYILHFLYSFLCGWPCRLFSAFGYGE